MCIMQFDWLIGLHIFTPLPRNASFINVKNCCVREEVSDVVFFFRQNFNKSLCKNIFLVSLHSRLLPLFIAPTQLTFPPSPTTFHMCPFLSSSPSTADQFARYTISNYFNPRSTYSVILAEEGVPIFDSRIYLSPLDISFGVEKLKYIFLSSSLVPFPSNTKRLKMQ